MSALSVRRARAGRICLPGRMWRIADAGFSPSVPPGRRDALKTFKKDNPIMQTVLGAFTRPWTMLPYPDAMWRLGRVFSAGGIMRCQGRLAIDLDSTEEEARAA